MHRSFRSVTGAGSGGDFDDCAGAEATQVLYQRYGRRIYVYCFHQLRSREEAEDAVQTTFLNAFRSLQAGTVAHAEQAWLYKIAQNVCIARHRTRMRRQQFETTTSFELLQETGAFPQPDAVTELIGLEDALVRMPEKQRRAILLREWQGLSYSEIADALEISQSAVEMLIFRARRALANTLEQPVAQPALRVAVCSESLTNTLPAASAGL